MTRTRRVAAAFCALAAAVGFAESSKPRVGVLDFEAKSVSQSDAQVVGELFTSELVASRRYDVVDRRNIQKLLSEQEFQLSECTDSSCAVKIGQVLALQYMIYGSVSKLGDTFIINVQLLNVGSAQIEASSREKFAKINDSYDIVRKVVAQLVGEEAPATSPASPEPRPRAFYVDVGAGVVPGPAVRPDGALGIEMEAAARYMFIPQFGCSLGVLLGYQFTPGSGIRFGVQGHIHLRVAPNVAFGLGLKGFPSYIGGFTGPVLTVQLFRLYLRGAVDALGIGGFSIDFGYSL